MKILNIIVLLGIAYSINIFPQEGLIKSFYTNDTLQSEINYSNNVRQGSAKYYYQNGKLKQELNYTDGKVEGVVKEYFENGNVKEVYTIEDGKRNGSVSLFDEDGKYLKDITYENGNLVQEEAAAEDTSSKQAMAQNEISNKKNSLKNEITKIPVPPAIAKRQNENNPEYLDSADVMPEPVGGIKNIMNKLIYPEAAKKKDIQGIVKVRAYVDEYGEVTQDEIIQGLGYGCDEAAKITVYYTRFTPGLIKGKPVKVQVIIPIEFKLSKK
ncbi:MAG: TonB family protein [Ignavibacteriaceae bacterium]